MDEEPVNPPNQMARPDRRYKDASAAPSVVSEKRVTFFLADSTFRELKLQSGYFQVGNLTGDSPAEEPGLPETPSALVREALDFWLDQFRKKADRCRTDKEWEERVARIRKALRR